MSHTTNHIPARLTSQPFVHGHQPLHQHGRLHRDRHCHAEGPQIARRGEPHPDDRISILLLVNTTLKDDLADFEKFKSRFAQIAPNFDTRLKAERGQHPMDACTFVIR